MDHIVIHHPRSGSQYPSGAGKSNTHGVWSVLCRPRRPCHFYWGGVGVVSWTRAVHGSYHFGIMGTLDYSLICSHAHVPVGSSDSLRNPEDREIYIEMLRLTCPRYEAIPNETTPR